MTNPIHDRIGGKYYRQASMRNWFYGFVLLIGFIWFLAVLDVSSTEPMVSVAILSMCASSVVIGIVALFSAPFAAQVASQLRKHETYDLIQITTLTRQRFLQGLLTGMLARFRERLGFPLSVVTILAVLFVLLVLPVNQLAWIILMPVLGLLGFCYLGLVGGIASGLMLKNTIGANLLAGVSHFVVLSIWILFVYGMILGAAFLYLSDFGETTDASLTNVAIVVAGVTSVPYLLMVIPVTLSYIFVRRT